MAEKDQEHLRIRLDAKLLRKIDASREKTGRTRTDEIEMRLLESFMRTDLEMVAEMAVHNALMRVERIEKSRALSKGEEPVDFYEAMVNQARKEAKALK